MSYPQPQRFNSSSSYPQSSSYPYQLHQDPSNVATHYQNQVNYSNGNQVYLQQIAGSTNQLNSTWGNQQHQQYPYNCAPPNINDCSFQPNLGAIYQQQYSTAPTPNYWAPGFSNYPPPPPPIPEHCSGGVPVACSTPEIQSTEAQEMNSQVKVTTEKNVKKPPVILVGRRRGGRILPTGVVKKRQVENKNIGQVGNSFLAYKAEVRRYTEKLCEEDCSNRSLVK